MRHRPPFAAAAAILMAALLALPCARAHAQDTSPGSDEAQPDEPATLPSGLVATQPRISPDAAQIAFLGALNGAANIWLGPADNPGAATQITEEPAPGVGEFRWAHTGEHILYVTGAPSDAHRCVRVVNLQTREVRDLSPPEGCAARIVALSSRRPDDALIATNQRDPAVFDLHRVNIRAARGRIEFENPGPIAPQPPASDAAETPASLPGAVITSFIVDHDLTLRFLRADLEDGAGFVLLRPIDGRFEPFLAFPRHTAPTSEPLGFDESGRVLYFLDDRARAHAALTAINVETGETSVLASLAHAPVLAALRRAGGHVQAVRTADPAAPWLVLDRAVEADFQFLRTAADGDLRVVSRSLDGNVWIVSYTEEGRPPRFLMYNRVERRVRGVF